MKLSHYAMKPMGDGGSGALACVATISPWAGSGVAAGTHAQERQTNGVVRPKGSSEGSTG